MVSNLVSWLMEPIRTTYFWISCLRIPSTTQRRSENTTSTYWQDIPQTSLNTAQLQSQVHSEMTMFLLSMQPLQSPRQTHREVSSLKHIKRPWLWSLIWLVLTTPMQINISFRQVGEQTEAQNSVRITDLVTSLLYLLDGESPKRVL